MQSIFLIPLRLLKQLFVLRLKKSPIIIHFFRYFACMKFNVLPKEVTNKENALNVSPPPFSLFSISLGNQTTALQNGPVTHTKFANGF